MRLLFHVVVLLRQYHWQLLLRLISLFLVFDVALQALTPIRSSYLRQLTSQMIKSSDTIIFLGVLLMQINLSILLPYFPSNTTFNYTCMLKQIQTVISDLIWQKQSSEDELS